MAQSANSLSIAHLTDIHLFDQPTGALAGINTLDSFRAVLAEIANLDKLPDMLLLTGDLTQDGTQPAYIALRKALESMPMPAYCLPGNHDNPSLIQELLGNMAAVNRRVQIKGWQILLLNSAVTNQVDGHLTDASLAWLEENLSINPDLPTLVALHHPALPLGSAWMDGIGLQNQAEFWQICDRHAQIRLVLSGHAHQEFDIMRRSQTNQVRYMVSPSTCVQFAPNHNKFKIDSRSPGFRLLQLHQDGSINTQVYRLDLSQFKPDLAVVGY